MRQLTTLTEPRVTLMARSDGLLVYAMRDTQWNAPDAKRDYMTQVSARVSAIYGARVRTTDATVFLDDLARAGLIQMQSVLES